MRIGDAYSGPATKFTGRLFAAKKDSRSYLDGTAFVPRGCLAAGMGRNLREKESGAIRLAGPNASRREEVRSSQLTQTGFLATAVA
jgi:hypothetical protein